MGAAAVQLLVDEAVAQALVGDGHSSVRQRWRIERVGPDPQALRTLGEVCT